MGKKLELTGKRFGRLTVIKEVGKSCGHTTWLCRCDCGNEIVTKGIHLTSGHTRSCSCAQKEIIGELNRKALAGRRFGKLTALRRIDKFGSDWICRCDCGNYSVTTAHRLVSGTTKSCGCYRSEFTIMKNTIHGNAKRTERSITYSSWASMWNRCKHDKEYIRKGRKVCERWRNFRSFIDDMGERPSLNYTLDRIDNNKGYSPDNCRWATAKEQMNNMSRNTLFEYNGEMKTISELSDISGFNYSTLRGRLTQYGWTVEDAITIPPSNNNRLKGYSFKRK